MAVLDELSRSLISGNREQVETFTRTALQQGMTPAEILNGGLLAGMEVVGRKFRENEFYVPEVLVAARAMKAAMDILKPLLVESGVQPLAKVVLGTVRGDVHDIGKNLVGMMLQGAGFEVIDIGINASAEKFVAAAREHDARLVGMSALLTTTMVAMGEVVEAIRDHDPQQKIRIMIGGAPVTKAYAAEIGADGYAPDAPSAVEVAKSLLPD